MTEGVQSSGNLGVKYGVYKSIFSVSINANLDFCFFNQFKLGIAEQIVFIDSYKVPLPVTISSCYEKFLNVA